MSKIIAIVAAMPEEIDAVKKIMTDIEEIKIHELSFYKGNINNSECVLAKCGIGKVNSARVTQILIDKFELLYVVNIGAAGAINDTLNYGDVVIGNRLIQHDFDVSVFGHKKGYIPGFGREIECSTDLLEKSKNAISKILDKNCKAVIGTICSGDIFCTSKEIKENIREEFNADCVEMEGAAIGQICKLANIPFIVIRSISDTPNGKNNIEFDKYLELAAKRCADFIQNLI